MHSTNAKLSRLYRYEATVVGAVAVPVKVNVMKFEDVVPPVCNYSGRSKVTLNGKSEKHVRITKKRSV